MLYTPLPSQAAVPIHAVGRVDLEPGEKGVVEVEPENQTSTHQIPVVAISNYDRATYTVECDGTERFGPNAPAPPTDPDDLTATFLRALEMENNVNVTIRDTRTTGNSREYEIHVIGYEEA